MHERYMYRALELARVAEGRTSPNPAVGAVLVRDGVIVGEGYHRFAGSDHAEAEAIRDAGSEAAGSTLYVTLEPCNHEGRTPACTDAIIEAGIDRVVYAISDRNTAVTGGGGDRLRQADLDVHSGVLEDEARYLNRFFFHHAETELPWIIAKFASSLDGKIATSTGESKWITGIEARARAHELRALVDAVIVGAGTVIEDDPELTARSLNGHSSKDNVLPQPTRIILDSRGRVPIDARVFDPELSGTTIAVGTHAFSTTAAESLEKQGVEIIKLPADMAGRIDLRQLLLALGHRGYQSVMVEGGGTVLGSFLEAKLVDEVWAFLSPSLIGGTDAPSAFGGNGIQRLRDRFEMESPEIERVGSDILIRGIRSGWKTAGNEHRPTNTRQSVTLSAPGT